MDVLSSALTIAAAVVAAWLALGALLYMLLIVARAIDGHLNARADRDRLRFRAALQERRLDALLRNQPDHYRIRPRP